MKVKLTLRILLSFRCTETLIIDLDGIAVHINKIYSNIIILLLLLLLCDRINILYYRIKLQDNEIVTLQKLQY